MADLFSLEVTAGGANGPYGASKAAESPLAKILADLRRKYAAAAGPQVGALMEYGVLPYASDIDVEDMARRMNEEQNDLHPPGSPWDGGQPVPYNYYGRQRSVEGLFLDQRLGADGGGQAAVSTTPPSSPNRKRQSGHFASLGEADQKMRATPRRTAAKSNLSHRSGLASASHAENLLCSTPHLRHLSAASIDMEGRGTFSTSRNLLSHLLPSVQSTAGAGSPDPVASSSSSKKGKSGAASMADYGTSVARSRANRQTAAELAAFIRVLTHEMSLEEFASVENEVFTCIFAFVHSTDNSKRLAGVAALDALIGVASSDEEKKAIKFANNLSNGLRANNVDYEFLAAVSQALGRMAMGAANVDYVEFEVTRALEWLRIERSDRRLAATLTLRELARNAPTAFYAKTNQTTAGHGGSNEFLDHIFPVLHDLQPIVRVCAADALAECLKILVDRKHRSTTGLLCQVYSKTIEGFKPMNKTKRGGGGISVGTKPPPVATAATEAAQHASLLVVGDMLRHCGNFMLPRFDEVCCAVLNLTGHSKALIRLEVVRLIPRLAQRCPGGFGRRYLKDSLAFLIDSASNAPPPRVGVDLRPAAFFAIGQLALAMSDSKGDGVTRSTIQIVKAPSNGEESSQPSQIVYHTTDGDIYSRLDEIFALVRSGLQKARQRSGGIGADTRCEALHCGADLVEALGSHAEKHIEALENDLFQSGLSDDLIACLRAISNRLPERKPFIEDRLLQELSMCLAGTPSAHCDPFLHRSAALSRGSGGLREGTSKVAVAAASTRSLSSSRPRLDSHSTARQGSTPAAGCNDKEDKSHITINMSTNLSAVLKLVLSLRTLGSFENSRGGIVAHGSCVTLLPFVRDVVAQYLAHPSSEVRREAALTCCLLLLPYDSRGSSSSSMPSHGGLIRLPLGRCSGKLLEEVLQKLLRVAVSDPSPSVRHCVVRALDLRYDYYLCQAHNLPPLFLLLQDEALSVRAAALQLLGRLARLNPAPILPDLRRTLIELILELRCGGDTGGGRESATRLLIVFLRSEALHRLVHPFLPSIIEALPLTGVAPRLASASLEALGELAQVTRTSLTPWVHQLVPHILKTLQDQSSASKQLTSLRTLGQIAGATGYVISPYLDYPQLLPQAADVLPGTKRAPWALRREVIRTFGILGALDPDRYMQSHKTRKGGGVGGGYFIENEEEHDSDALAVRNPSNSFKASSCGRVLGAETSLKDVAQVSSSSCGAGRISARNGVFQRAVVGKEKKSGTFPDSSRKDADDNEPAHLYMYEQYAMTAVPVSNLPPAHRLTPADEDFYPTVAVQALTRILKDNGLAVHHGMVMQAVMYIFNALGLRCVPFLERIVPHILKTIRTCGQLSLREALLQQVASLSGIVRDHLRPYVPAIFEVVEEFWSTTRHLATILTLIEKMAIGVPDDFRKYVPQLVPQILASIESSQIHEWSNSRRPGVGSAISESQRLELILKCVRSLRGTLGDYLHILVPALVKLAGSLVNSAMSPGGSNSSNSGQARLAVLAIQTMSILLQTTDGTSGTKALHDTVIPAPGSLPARAAQPLLGMLSKESHANKAVGLAIVEALCVCAKQLGRSRWMPFYHVAARDAIIQWQDRVGMGNSGSVTSQNETKQEEGRRQLVGLLLYDEMVRELILPPQRGSVLARLQSGEASIEDSQHRLLRPSVTEPSPSTGFDVSEIDGDLPQPSIQPIPNQSNKHRVNQANLQRSWDVSQRSTREDWDEWMRRLAVQLLREAPSPALRATAGLAQAYQPLARELFAAAFVCCWTDLSDQYRQNLVHSLEEAFVADVSPEILQTLLNLCEFMEHDGVEGGLPIDIAVLAELALKCRSYAKALHYKEREHNVGMSGGACVEALISINKKLDLPEAALGVLKAAQMEFERRGVHSWENPHYEYLGGTSQQSGLALRFFHQHHALDMAYSVMSTEDEIAALGGGSWAGVEMQESWLAKLGSWGEALAMYERKLEENPNDVDAILGCMRCLDARGEWRRVIELAGKSWMALSGDGQVMSETSDGQGGSSLSRIPNTLTPSRNHRKALKFCAQAAWRLGQWDELETYASQLFTGGNDSWSTASVLPKGSGVLRDGGLPRVDYDGAFYSAVLHIHRKEWSLAADAIDVARRAMDSRFTALMAESYKRAYPSMVMAQALAEMEEIIAFRKLEGRVKAAGNCHPANRADEVESRQQLLSVWRRRLAGCRVDAEVHSSLLAVRSLVLGPSDEIDSTLTLSALSRQAQCFKLAERLLLDPLVELGADINGAVFGFGLPPSLGLGLNNEGITVIGQGGGVDRLVTGEPVVFLPHYGEAHEQYSQRLVQEAGGAERLKNIHSLYYAYVKHLWAMDHHEEAMGRLSNLCDVVDMVTHCVHSYDSRLRVSCWLKLGEFKIAESNPPGSYLPERLQVEVLTSYKRATYSLDCGYKAWHAWALLNFRLAQQNHESANMRTDIHPASAAGTRSRLARSASKSPRNHVVAACTGFVKAISLGTKRWSASVQQDMLNFLTCLFKYRDLPEVAATINALIGSVTLEAWLGVLPQLLARIHIKSPSVRSVLHPLLIRLGAKHPQALMYPLSVLLKSPVVERKIAAESLMNSLKAHSNALVEEALMVSSELIRVAILWLELWWEGLEDASRLYFGEGNVSGMLDVLLPLHDQLEKGPTTRREHDFYKSFGRDLAEAHAYVKEYIRLTTSNGGVIPSAGGFMPGGASQTEPSGLSAVRQNAEAEAKLNQAWDLYYTVFRRINKQLPGLTSLELSQCSPALLQARNLELGVPGSYRVDGSYVKIAHFVPSVQVITSKQRPRKITLRGSDGKDYVFLLKGHEDLRQDERVMQLFGLVNALLARDRRTNNHDLNIQRYAIAPLSHNAGVVGWVPHCDTLHSLIRDYRESKKIPLNMENREMMKLTPNYDLLTVMQKVEVFSEALERTDGKGNDLYEVLWIKSTNSEEWLERRTKFTRSLAVMSMVGYILGLGDRHPSNLMLDQISGRVLHIDFGDCFEVAMHREKFPEKIPFRLTRMLIKAMEVSGIEGSYRSTCERTMGVLRDNRDSLVAMLEAFVYDPLISWRLLGQSSGGAGEDQPAVTVAGNDDSTTREVPVSGGKVDVVGMSVGTTHTMLQEPIREGQEEDSADEEEGNTLGSAEKSGNLDSDGAPVVRGGEGNAFSAAHAKSLQMYSNMQAMAAEQSASSRIASITGGNTQSIAAEGSLARSRVDRSLKQREVLSFIEGEEGAANEEALNEKALKVIKRVQDKLAGTDFQGPGEIGDPLDVQDQVQRLIVQATSSENLCQLFIGWCAFW